MHAMVLEAGDRSLTAAELPSLRLGPRQVLVRVAACGVCRTDLHVVDGELAHPKPRLIPGHEVVGHVIERGADVDAIAIGARIGIPWLGSTCGACSYCRNGRENLCDSPGFTGYTLDGGYADYAAADASHCVPIPDRYTDAAAAPLLCAGLIGYRAYRMSGDGRSLGLYGFGAAAHILTQVAVADGRTVYAFTRPGDTAAQAFARRLGASWAGGADESAPEQLDSAILFAPVGALVPVALQAVRKGGRVICAGIHMSDIPSFPYRLLWEERQVRSVANLTRQDGRDFMAVAAAIEIRTEIHLYPLAEANRALEDLRHGRFNGAAVLIP